MDLSVLRIRGGALAALIALGTIGAGKVHATQTLTVTSGATGTITCNTLTGPGSAASVTIHIGTALVSPATLAVTVTTANGLVVTPSAGTSFTSTAQSLTYTVNAAAGCVGTSSTSGSPSSIQFAVAGPLTATAAETVTVTQGVETITVSNGAAAANLTCNTSTGPGTAAVITLTAGTSIVGPATAAITAVAPTGFTVTPVGATSFSAGVNTLQYSLNAASGCGASSGNFTFTPAGGSASTVAATDTITYVSQLVASPSLVTVQCTYSSASGGTWTPGPAQTVSVTSAASGGTAFTINNGTNSESAPASYLTLSSLAGGTATTTPITFTVAAKATTTGSGGTSGCGGYTTLGTHTSTLYLDNSPAPPKLVTVQMQIVSASVLTVPATNSLTYVKGSGAPGYVQVPVSSTPSGLFTSINTSFPVWLTVDSTSGTLPKSFRFSTTTACDSLAPGTYTATVNFSVAGYADTPLTITLLLTNKAPTLSVETSPGLLAGSTGTVQNMNWTLGTAQPTAVIIAQSSDSPIGFTAAGGGTLGPVPAEASDLAYNFGTQLGVTFSPLAFAAAVPGTTLTGSVTLTWGSPASTIVVTFNVHVLSAAPTLTSVVPSSIPTSTAGHQIPITLSGTGFVIGTDPTQATRVGLIPQNGSSIVSDAAITSVNVQATNIFLTITVPSGTDANLPFATGGPVTIGICNPNGTSCSTPQAQVTLTIGAGPIIQAVTSASSFIESSSPTTAAYDMLSVFGANFCPACSSTTVVTGTLASATDAYPAALPLPDSVHYLTASFYHPGAAWIGNAPILFATNNQVNLLVPGGLPTSGSVDIVIGYASSAALPASGATEPSASASYAIYPMTAAATNPGVYTVGADGQGVAAVLNSATYALISSANPAGMRSTGADSDSVALYVTGLGVPDSSASNTSGGGSTAPADCISTSAYEGSFSPSLTTMDGAVIQYSLIDPSRYPPCMASQGTLPTVTVGGVSAPVSYAGFVDSAVAGLYQVNVTLPSTTGSFSSMTGGTITNITAPVELPVVVTSNSVASQQGVGIWVAPRLYVTAPTALSGMVGVPWSSSNNAVVAAQGTPGYLYALSSGTLPAGLTLTNSNNTGVISGTPAANTGGSYIVTVTATDSAGVPVTGSVTFTIVVAADLFMTSSGTAPYTPGAASSAPYSNVTSVTATGGKVAYTYTISVTPPMGGSADDITVNSSTGYVSVAGTAVTGSYSVTVTATDSTTGTPLTGSITFTITLS